MSGPRHGVGHNGGPSMEAGFAFRKHAWSKARHGLLGERLPIEVLRRRVARAEALGLPYRNYASIRAATGCDVIGFLFSSNALGLLRADNDIPASIAAKLSTLPAQRIVAAHRGIDPARLLQRAEIDRAGAAPRPFSPWRATRSALTELLGHDLPRDGIVLVADAPFEAEWVEAGKLAGMLRADAYFSA